MKKLEIAVKIVSSNVQYIRIAVEANSVRVRRLKEKQYNLALMVKGVEKRVLKRVSDLIEWMEDNKTHHL